MKHITLLISTLFILGTSLSAQETTATDLMAKALYEENINADYQKASEYYQEIVDDFPSDKKNCSQATYRLGICAEKQGIIKAHEFFEDVIELYPEEQDLVFKARSKLNKSEGIKYFTDDRDGRVYKYVAIGDQYWMAENLAYMPFVSPLKEQDGIWVYDFDGRNVDSAKLTENYSTYGCLYDWETAKKSCPDGWHLPGQEEWISLENYIGFNDPEANQERLIDDTKISFTKLVSPDYWTSSYRRNITQFSALPGGHRSVRRTNNSERAFFYGKLSNAAFWSSTEDSPNYVWARKLEKLDHSFFPQLDSPKDGFSVRCIANSKPIVKSFDSPKVRFTDPSLPGTKVRDNFPIEIRISEFDKIKNVDFYAISQKDTIYLGTDFSEELRGSYQILWRTKEFTDGKYSLMVEASDFANNKVIGMESFEVLNQDNPKFDGLFTDPRDNKSYKYVEIGSQTWMAENLNYLKNDGNGSWCLNNLQMNCESFGRLYNQETALKVCPFGWHLPTDDEWMTLESFLGMDSAELYEDYLGRETGNVGYKMKSISGWSKPLNYDNSDNENDGNGNNQSGLNILPGGWMYYGYSGSVGTMTLLWTSTKVGNSLVYLREFYYGGKSISRYSGGSEIWGAYVRCIKD